MSTYAPAPRPQEPTAAGSGPAKGSAPAAGDDPAAGGARAGGRPQLLRAALRRSAIQLAPAALTAGLICACTFVATGGLQLETRTSVELLLTLLAGLLAAIAIVVAPRGTRYAGAWPTALLFALTALTAVSVAWSVSPDLSWQEAGQMLSYSALFGAMALLARAFPGRWQGVLAGVVIASVVICGYALLTKVFPAQLAAEETVARMRAPFGYWNATGLCAAIGIVGCLWLGTRRTGHALLSALAYPAAGLLMVALMLAYSRGSLAVALVGAAVWLCLVPLRLRGALMLIVCAAFAAIPVAFDFASSALSSEDVPLPARVSAGHQLGALLLAIVLSLLALGMAIGFALARRPPSTQTRRRAAAVLLSCLALLLVAGVAALAHSQRGLTGTISHELSTLTNPNVSVPNTPGRLTAVASVRARYWKQAIQVFEAHPLLGAGGGGYDVARKQYETGTLEVAQAHGYMAQTLADLGIVGTLLTIALLLTWCAAAGAATHPFGRRWAKWRWRSTGLAYTPERIGLLTMLSIVVTFGVHSFVDWTWYVPGTACIALICAGWLAGRGPIEAPTATARGPWRHLLPWRVSPTRVAAASAAIVLALLAAWSEWQPQRSAEASEEALRLSGGAALAAARTGVDRDPLSLTAMEELATVQESLGQTGQARATRLQAVRKQPANPTGWRELGEHDLLTDPRAALAELRAAYYLYPSARNRENYVIALNEVSRLPRANGRTAAQRDLHVFAQSGKRLRRDCAHRVAATIVRVCNSRR
jgi:O-Antigen ligase